MSYYLVSTVLIKCLLAFPLMTMCPYSKQVQDIQHYGASVGDDLDAKMN